MDKGVKRAGKLQAEVERLMKALKDRNVRVSELNDENNTLREALEDAIHTVRRSHLSSIGSINNTYLPQIDVKTVEGWEEALK